MSLVGYSPWGCKRVGHNLATKQQLSAKKSLILYDSIYMKCAEQANLERENVGYFGLGPYRQGV